MIAPSRRLSVAVRSLLAPALLSVALSAPEALAQEQEITFVTEPQNPVAGQPFRLLFSGDLLAFAPSHLAEDRFVTFEEETIKVTQRGGLVGIPTTFPYLASVEVEALPEGIWNVELVLDSDNTPPPVAPAATKNLELGTIYLSPPYRLDGPSVGYSSTAVSFTVSRLDSCAELGEITFPTSTTDGHFERKLTIPWLSGCLILPPEPTLMTLETGLVGPLMPGTWSIEVVDNDGFVVTRKELEILPDPVRLQEDRFQVEVVWFNNLASDLAFPVTRPTVDSALYAFFIESNWEVMLKVLDGCEINGHYWVFVAANTDQGYDVLVTDTETGAEWTYQNPLGTASPAVTDTSAFPCE